jgi:hypothetical protein
MTKENSIIKDTLKKLGAKLLEECQLDQKIEIFIKNYEKIVDNKNSRLNLSKYAVRCIVE